MNAPAPGPEGVPELQLKPLSAGAAIVLKEIALQDDSLPGRRTGSKSVGGGGSSSGVNSALAAVTVMGRERVQSQPAASNAASAGSLRSLSRRSTFSSFLGPSGAMHIFEIGRAVRAQLEPEGGPNVAASAGDGRGCCSVSAWLCSASSG